MRAATVGIGILAAVSGSALAADEARTDVQSITAGEAGFYAISDSMLRVADAPSGQPFSFRVQTSLKSGDEKSQLDCRVIQAPAIPVSVFPQDAIRPDDACGEWMLMAGVAEGSAAARVRAWGDPGSAARSSRGR